MSKLDELIQELCPDGVEYIKFNDVCIYVRGVTYNKSQEINVISQKGISILRANNITLDTNILNFDDVKKISLNVKIKDSQYLKQGDILICAGSGSKEHIGKVAYCYSDMDYSFGGFMGVIRTKELLNSRFLFHVLTSGMFKSYLNLSLNSSTINNLNNQIMSNFTIPVPPLEVQREIVRILDNFTELTARKQQYEYYLNDVIQNCCTKCIEYRKLGELGSFYGGLTGKSKNDFKDGNAKFISYMNVFSNISLNINTSDTVVIKENEKQNIIQLGDILFTGSSENTEECGMTSVLTIKPKVPLYLNSFCFGYRLNNPKLFEPEFTKYLFRSNLLRTQIKKTASGVTRFNISKKKMEKVIVPIIPLEKQIEIASILDRFDKLCNDISEGLPAEIEARQKQYEYYRDEMLTFKPLQTKNESIV